MALEVFVRGVIFVILFWIGAALISRLSKHIQMYQSKVLADTVSIKLFEKVYKHTIGLSLDYHENRKTGEVIRQLSKAKDDMFMMINSFFDEFMINITSFVLVTTFFIVMRWQVAVVMLVYLPIFILVTRHFAKNINTSQDIINTKMEQIHGSAQEAMDSIVMVHSFNSQKREATFLTENNRITHEAMKIKIRAWQKLAFWQGTIINFARLSIIGVASYFVWKEVMTIGDLLMLSIWAFYIYQPMYQLSDLYAKFKEGVNSVGRVHEIIKLSPSIANPENSYKPDKVSGEVVFKDVSFSYAERDPVLQGVDFQIHPGKQLAIVGPSGSGKSTITKLLLRFYDIQKGSISIDGKDIREWDLEKLRDTIGIVLQETILFNDTIYNNIRYGRYDASEDEIMEAAKKAYAHDFIMELPEKYQSKVGERGIKLSGGEKQRILIARTILKNPKILILDEATSSLDSESEVIVQDALEKLSKNRTTIVIAHRLSTIMNSDEIVFFSNGKIQERGTHEELLKANGKYQKYIELQKRKHEKPKV